MSVSLVATPLRDRLAAVATDQHAITRLEPARSPATLALADPAVTARGTRLRRG